LERLAPLSVLIAGGDNEFRELVKRHVGGGVRIIGDTADLDEAVSLVSRLQPDVVLLDIGVSRMDGPTAARRIKRERAETKVVFLTSGDGAAEKEGDGHSQDPFRADALLPKRSVVREILSRPNRRIVRRRRPRR
jgi:CheY-like chemotaxis protein